MGTGVLNRENENLKCFGNRISLSDPRFNYITNYYRKPAAFYIQVTVKTTKALKKTRDTGSMKCEGFGGISECFK